MERGEGGGWGAWRDLNLPQTPGLFSLALDAADGAAPSTGAALIDEPDDDTLRSRRDVANPRPHRKRRRAIYGLVVARLAVDRLVWLGLAIRCFAGHVGVIIIVGGRRRRFNIVDVHGVAPGLSDPSR